MIRIPFGLGGDVVVAPRASYTLTHSPQRALQPVRFVVPAPLELLQVTIGADVWEGDALHRLRPEFPPVGPDAPFTMTVRNNDDEQPRALLLVLHALPFEKVNHGKN